MTAPTGGELNAAETNVELQAELPTPLAGPVVAEIQAQYVNNSQQPLATMKVLVLRERTVSVGLYRVIDPDSEGTIDIVAPTNTQIEATLNRIYEQAGVRFSVQASPPPIEVHYDTYGGADGRVQTEELPAIFQAVAEKPGDIKIVLTRQSGRFYPNNTQPPYVRASTLGRISVLFTETILEGGGDIAFAEAHEMGHALTLPATNEDDYGHDVGPPPKGTGRLMAPGYDPNSGIALPNPAGPWLPHEDWERGNINAGQLH